MDEKEMQTQFIQWLAKKTGAKSEQELTEVIKKLQSTEGAMEQTVQEFKAEIGNEQPAFKLGGKFDYLDCLAKLKKGGKMDCGCGAKSPKVQKAFLGSVLGALKGASTIMKGGVSAVKGAQTLATIGKTANTLQKGLTIGKNIMSGIRPTIATPTTTQGVAQGATMGNTIPSIGTQVAPTLPNVGAPLPSQAPLNMAPQGLKPVGTKPVQPGMLPMKAIAAPRLVEKGAKLKAKPDGKKSVPLMKK